MKSSTINDRNYLYTIKLEKILFYLLVLIFPFSLLLGQAPIIIDHNSTDLSGIPAEWIDSAKSDLFIAYGHTSHGSQLISGMDALESFYSSGQYNWSHTGGEDELHLFEGDGYGDGYLDHDCGYAGWDDETREYLDLFPTCNVMVWSWCGQVNSVDLTNHYLNPMQQLEAEYPNVKFVYMTGHLEGQGPNGSLFLANQQIRDFCSTHNKILFDFADIEKYSPDADTNFQLYNATDACDYDHPGGMTRNWAVDWINNNPTDELTQINQHCTACAHSENLNCVKKGMAAWWMWARLAGWQGQNTAIYENAVSDTKLYPNPVKAILHIENIKSANQLIITDARGIIKLNKTIKNNKGLQLDLEGFASGIYTIQILDNNGNIFQSLFIKQ